MAHPAYMPMTEEELVQCYDKETRTVSLRYLRHRQRVVRWLHELKRDDRQHELMVATQNLLREWGFETHPDAPNAVMHLLLEVPVSTVMFDFPKDPERRFDGTTARLRLDDRFYQTLEATQWGAPVWDMGVHKFRVNYGCNAINKMRACWVDIFQINYQAKNIFDPDQKSVGQMNLNQRWDHFEKTTRMINSAILDQLVELGKQPEGCIRSVSTVNYPMYLYVQGAGPLEELVYRYNHQYRRVRNLKPVTMVVDEKHQTNLHYVTLLLEST